MAAKLQRLADMDFDSPSVFQARVVVGPALYFVGIVDTLQTWDNWKKIERWTKLANGQDGKGLSCVPPEAYKKRFDDRIAQIIDHASIKDISSGIQVPLR